MSAITVQDSINKIDQIKKGNTTYDVVDSNARTAIGEAYKKPTAGIPDSDLESPIATNTDITNLFVSSGSSIDTTKFIKLGQLDTYNQKIQEQIGDIESILASI